MVCFNVLSVIAGKVVYKTNATVEFYSFLKIRARNYNGLSVIAGKVV